MSDQKRVCVVGGGPSGLCAARHSVDAGHNVTIFERQNDLGGTWLYSPEINSVSALYEKMNTNIPKEVMSFEHLPFETDYPQSFVSHQEVLAYLRRYSDPIRNLIKFNTTVTKIQRKGSEWEVTVKPSNTETDQITLKFDVLFICNGHFTNPRIPKCAEKLKIPWIHSCNYRRPDEYKNLEIAIVGSGPSGADISVQVSKVAKKIHLLHNGRYKLGKPGNILDTPSLVDVDEDGRTLILENDEKLTNISAVIFCTGFLYELPFFEKELVEAKSEGKYISPMYQHFIHPKYPKSLFFIGLCWLLIPCIYFDLQVHYALTLIDGSSKVPSKDEMESFEANRLRELDELGLPLTFYHCKGGEDQWSYFELLAKLSNRSPPAPVIRLIYDHAIKQMFENLATFKSYRYKITGPDSFEYEPLVDLDCS